ncbi:hypothetical protein P4679_25220 [Priestia megaterium]|uniref:hypothetical protein n=1 Tax=Priestia megaterium TaxID=1404 RepID=UPI002E1A77B1|nr:hypothetical protein [Priestia megaterium]
MEHKIIPHKHNLSFLVVYPKIDETTAIGAKNAGAKIGIPSNSPNRLPPSTTSVKKFTMSKVLIIK